MHSSSRMVKLTKCCLSLSSKKSHKILCGFFVISERSSWVASATKDATNEGGRAERPTEQRKPQPTQATRAVSKARTDTHEARERKEPLERETPRGADQAKRNAAPQASRRGTKGDPQRASTSACSGRRSGTPKGWASRRGFTPLCPCGCGHL